MKFSPGCNCCASGCVLSSGIFDLVNNCYGGWVGASGFPDRWIINGSGMKYSNISVSEPWYTTVDFQTPNNLLVGPLQLCWNGSGLAGTALTYVISPFNPTIEGSLEERNITPSGTKFGIEVLRSDDGSGNWNLRLLGGLVDCNNYLYTELSSSNTGSNYLLHSAIGKRENGIDTEFLDQERTVVARPTLSYVYDFQVKYGYTLSRPDCSLCNNSCCDGTSPAELTLDLFSSGYYQISPNIRFDCSQLTGTHVLSQSVSGNQYCTWIGDLNDSILIYYERDNGAGYVPILTNQAAIRIHNNYGFWGILITIIIEGGTLTYTVLSGSATNFTPCELLNPITFTIDTSVGCGSTATAEISL